MLLLYMSFQSSELSKLLGNETAQISDYPDSLSQHFHIYPTH